MLVTLLGNIDGTTFVLDVGTELGHLYGSFDGSNYDKLEGLFLDELLGSDAVVEIGATDGRTESNPNTRLGSLDGYLDGSNDGKLFRFNIYFSFYFTHLMSPLFGLCEYRRVWCLLFCLKIIVAKEDYFD